MLLALFGSKFRNGLFLVICFLVLLAARAQAPSHYEPTIESLNSHPLAQWYADAKLGIFVHWGLYSVPGWAPTVHSEHDFESLDYITHNPYALARALQKLDAYSKRVPLVASPSTAHLFIVQPLFGMNIGNLFSTHPPIYKRIERLTGRPQEYQ